MLNINIILYEGLECSPKFSPFLGLIGTTDCCMVLSSSTQQKVIFILWRVLRDCLNLESFHSFSWLVREWQKRSLMPKMDLAGLDAQSSGATL